MLPDPRDNPDPLAVAPQPEVEPRRGRLGCSVALFAAIVLLGSVVPAPRGASQPGEYPEPTVASLMAVTAALPGAPVDHAGSALAASSAVNAGAPQRLAGYISWADPDLGGDYLATRFPRGTIVRLCTPNRCIVRRSNDFGPSAAIDPPRIADLAVLDWEQLTGLPRSRGLARGTVEAIDEIALPPTDMEEKP